MKKLSQPDDVRKLPQEPGRDAVARDAESCSDKAVLSDDDLARVSAAGEGTVPTMNPEVLLGRHDIPADAKERKS